MNSNVAHWQRKRTDQSRSVEEAFRRAGFATVDAYRHNSASIRVRVVDPRFSGMSPEERDKTAESVIEQLPEEIQADIVNLILLYPGEEKASFRAFLMNEEFEKGESKL